MNCNRWNDDWIGFLYGELEPEEERAARAHLDECSACTATMQGLQESRELLRQSAPVVPFPRRVVILKGRRMRPAMAIGGGLLAAAAVFALGFVTAPLLRPTDGGALASNPTIEARLARLEQQATQQVTQQDLQQGIDQVLHRIEVDRARDLEFVLSEITAVEMRTGRSLKYQREALLETMLASNPGFRER